MDGLRVGNPRNWWHSVKLITGQKTKSTQTLRGLANLHGDGNMKELATRINVFFHQVSAGLNPLDDTATPVLSDVCPSEFTIDLAEVERKMSEIDIHKAPGPDGLPNWILRDFSAQLAEPVCAIFNASIREGFIPPRWKGANIIPVPKVRPLESDLRPISLTATLAKLLESFIGQWILERVNNKLDARQYGALKGRSTTHALVDMMHHWHSSIDKGQSVHTVFIDFAKAFDSVDHNIVVTKMRALDVPDIIIRWLCSFSDIGVSE